MTSRCRSISRPALNLFKSFINKPQTRPMSSSQLPRSFPTFSRLPLEMGCVQSLLPFHSAVSSARLTSCLGVDNSRSLSQEVELLSRVQHRNLISLVGYCEQFGGQGTEGIRILVYEYASNGSLLEYIIGRNGKSLAWRQRVNIAIGAAKELGLSVPR